MSLIAFDPNETFPVWLPADDNQSEAARTVFQFRHLTIRQRMELERIGDEVMKADKETDEDLRKMLAALEKHLAKPEDLSVKLSEDELWHMFWRVCRWSRLASRAKKNSASPSPISSDKFAAGSAAPASLPNAPTPPAT